MASKLKPEVKPSPFKGLTGEWCCVCPICRTLNVYTGTSQRQAPPTPLTCKTCDDRAVAREERKRLRQEAAFKQRYGAS